MLQGFRIYRSLQPGAKSAGTLVREVGSTTFTFDDELASSGHFYYQVTAVYDQGESAPSNEVQVEVRPPALTTLRISTNVGGEIILQWTGASGQRYDLQSTSNPGSAWQTVETIVSAGETVTRTVRPEARAMFYRTRQQNP